MSITSACNAPINFITICPVCLLNIACKSGFSSFIISKALIRAISWELSTASIVVWNNGFINDTLLYSSISLPIISPHFADKPVIIPIWPLSKRSTFFLVKPSITLIVRILSVLPSFVGISSLFSNWPAKVLTYSSLTSFSLLIVYTYPENLSDFLSL